MEAMMICSDCEEPLYPHDPVLLCSQCGVVMHAECAMLDDDGDPYCEPHYTALQATLNISDAELNRLVKNEALTALDHKETCTCAECLEIDADLDKAFNS